MNRSISLWQFAGFLFTSAAGVLLHFLYDLSGQNVLVGLFSAVNESIWEHMKLLFFPMFIFALIQYIIWGKQYPFFWCAKLAGILLGLLLIPILYYSYTGILGVTADWVNIAIFFIASGASYYAESRLMAADRTCTLLPQTAFILICFIGVMFMVFTFFPPEIPLFADPGINT